MRIDLHCHTKSIKKGDGSERNVTPELFKSKVQNADVKILAITNHNVLDLEQYNILKDTVKDFCQVWPGVEIDVQEPGLKRWHLIIVANPKDVNGFSDSVINLFKGQKLEECTHTLDEICTAFKNNDVIYIAHYHEKKPAIPDEDAEKLHRLVADSSRVFMETANPKSMSVFANFRKNVLVGSDVKEWNHYEDCTFAELKLPVDSFEQFCLLSKRDESVVQTLLNKKQSKLLTAHPAEKVDLPLRIYADINVIFGQKGTGKTQIVNSLYDSMKSAGFKCVKYVASERDDGFKSLLKTNGLEIDLQKMGAEECQEQFKSISEWADKNATHFENYLNWKKTEGNNANKQRMRITLATSILNHSGEQENKHQKDKKTIDDIVQLFQTIDTHEYLNNDKCLELSALLFELNKAIYECRRNDLINQYSVFLANYSINTIKSVADQSTNSVSKPSSTGLSEFAECRIDLLKRIKDIQKNLSVPEINIKERIGCLDEKGDIYINTKFRILCEESLREEFRGQSIRKLKELIETLEYIQNRIFDVSISETVQSFNTLCSEMNISTIESFVGCSRQVVNSDGVPYSPSNGEKGMLLLQRTITNDADAYFLDEPELGMGNSYIDSNIRPILIGLAKKHKYVVVATHNANIAVRTLPYMSIYRTHSNGTYSTFVGNPFSDRLVKTDDSSSILNWAEESMRSLEGSRDAFYERKDIYESNSTEN